MFRKRKNEYNKALLIPYNEQDRAKMEEIGFIFRGNVDNEYVYIDIPCGWSYKKHTDEKVLYGHLYDSKNRLRADYIVGNPGGDSFEMLCRYRVYYDEYEDNHLRFKRYVITDSYDRNYPAFMYNDYKHMHKFVIWATAPTLKTPEDNAYVEWLSENYPDYKNPFAYWEESDVS